MESNSGFVFYNMKINNITTMFIPVSVQKSSGYCSHTKQYKKISLK